MKTNRALIPAFDGVLIRRPRWNGCVSTAKSMAVNGLLLTEAC
jgi:hypothetical protein